MIIHLVSECEAGKFGEDCTETCHCLDDVACDRVTGHCPNDTCAGGWVGEICQDRPCSEAPCQNDGTCLDTPEEGPDYYTCTCTEGWEGTDCDEEIDECASDPCQNGGTCTDAFAEYACACTDKYEGDNCEVEIPGAGEDGGSAG
ncbi:fibropellin-1-like, partial [Branchiostoma floridae]|uniref:Fibropellin-1-like n=1 Tax=Branchiostoma floridae TaxID=7739 RepID=A0A9J7N9B4_BRAFL